MKLPTPHASRHSAKPAAEPPKPLAQQQNDFTEEGSPPPGRVGNAPPRSTPQSKLAKRKP